MTLTRISTGACHATGTTAAAYTHTLADAALAGDVLVVSGNSNGTHAANGMTVSDSVNGVNFTTILEQDLSNASTRWLQTFVFQTPVDLASGTTITFTPYAANTASTFSLDIFRGATATIDTGPLGQSPATGTTSLTSALSPVPKSGSLVLSFGSFSSGTLTAGSPMTLGTTDATGPSTAVGYVLGADGTTNYQNTWTSTVSTSNANVVVALLPAAGGSAGGFSTSVHPGHGPGRFARFLQRAAAFTTAIFTNVAATEALATGTANDANVTIAANASAAQGTGTAYDAAVVDSTTSSGMFSTAMHPGRGPGRFARFYQRAAGFIFAVFAPATEALGTGTANDANIAIAANASAAQGTGTANDANIAIAANASAAQATGTAYDATVVDSTTSSSVPSTAMHPGRGPSRFARFFRSPNAGFTTPPVSGDVNAAAGAATGTGTAYDANVLITANATNGASTGSASDASASISGAAGAATGSTQTGSAAAILANATAALGTGSSAATASLAVNATAALATGTAYDATVIAVANPAVGIAQNARHPGRGPSTARFTAHVGGFSASQTSATEALGTGTAFDATVSIAVNPATATAVGTANDANTRVAANPSSASATGTSNAATVSLGVTSAAALSTVAANAALVALRVNPVASTGIGASYDVASGFKLFVDAQPALATALPNGLWTARPKVASTGRPGSGTTARPNSGITIDPG